MDVVVPELSGEEIIKRFKYLQQQCVEACRIAKEDNQTELNSVIYEDVLTQCLLANLDDASAIESFWDRYNKEVMEY